MKKGWLILVLAFALAACSQAKNTVPDIPTGNETETGDTQPMKEEPISDPVLDQDVPAPAITETGSLVMMIMTVTPESQKSDKTDNMEPSSIFVDSVQVIILESYPVQVKAIVNGSLPDSCTIIQETQSSYDETSATFDITIQTARPAEVMCAQMLTPFEETVTLKTNGLAAGTYTVHAHGITTTFELTADQ